MKDRQVIKDGGNLEFYFLNTHFDHMGDTARLESARLIKAFVREKTEGLPVVITGDFNCGPSEPPYAVITSGTPVLSDACRSLGLEGEPTFNGFGNSEENERIDFIFTNDNWQAESYKMLKIIKNGIYISDHYPVISRIEIKD